QANVCAEQSLKKRHGLFHGQRERQTAKTTDAQHARFRLLSSAGEVDDLNRNRAKARRPMMIWEVRCARLYFDPVIVKVRTLSAGILTSSLPVAAATPVPAPAPAAAPMAAPLPPPANAPITAPAPAPPPIFSALPLVWLLPLRLTAELQTVSPLMELSRKVSAPGLWRRP